MGLNIVLMAWQLLSILTFPLKLATKMKSALRLSKIKNLPATTDFLAGRHHGNLHRLKADLTKICQSYVNWLGDAPLQITLL